MLNADSFSCGTYTVTSLSGFLFILYAFSFLEFQAYWAMEIMLSFAIVFSEFGHY